MYCPECGQKCARVDVSKDCPNCDCESHCYVCPGCRAHWRNADAGVDIGACYYLPLAGEECAGCGKMIEIE